MKQESVVNLNEKVEKESNDLKSNFDRVFEETGFVQQSVEEFEETSESIAIMIEQVRVDHHHHHHHHH